MRQYPRRVYKTINDSIKVFDEKEEIEASGKGYESHWLPRIVEKQKGTDREILRGEFTPEEVFDQEDPKDTIEYYEGLKWPKLKTEAKRLESVYNTEIVTRKAKRDDILDKIRELLDGNS